MALDDQLILAIRKNNVEALKRILIDNLTSSSSLELRSGLGAHPLRYALTVRSQECALLLIEHGGVTHDPSELLLLAAREGYVPVVKSLIRHGFDVKMTDSRGLTALHVARGKGVIELLLANGAKIDAKDCNGNTPIHYACKRCDPDAVELLIDCGADVNPTNNKDKTPLHVLITRISEGSRETIARKLLTYGASVKAERFDGRTLLHCLERSYKPSLEFVKHILTFDVNINAPDSSGRTPLHCAVRYPEIVQLYLSRLANINSACCCDQTPLKDLTKMIENPTSYYYNFIAKEEQFDSWILSKEYLIQHIVKLQAAGFYIRRQNLKLAEPNRKFMPFTDQDCKSELQGFRLNIGISLTDFLNDTMHSDYIRNNDLFSKLTKISDSTYPIYGRMIMDKYQRDVRRVRLLRFCMIVIGELPLRLPSLPGEIWKKILINLDNDDLRTLEATLSATRDLKEKVHLERNHARLPI